VTLGPPWLHQVKSLLVLAETEPMKLQKPKEAKGKMLM
jgi:hypothetical protein